VFKANKSSLIQQQTNNADSNAPAAQEFSTSLRQARILTE